MSALTDLLEAEAEALAAEQRDRDFDKRQAARRRRVAGLPPGVICCDPRDWPRGQAAGLAGHPAIAPADVVDVDSWQAGYADGELCRKARRQVVS